MVKLCTSCGTQISDEDINCPSCGALTGSQVEQVPQETAALAATYEIPEGNTGVAANKTSTTTYIGIAVVGVIAIIIIALFASLFGRGAYTKPIDRMIKGMMNEDSAQYLSAFPEYIARGFEENVDRHNATALFYIEREFGENVKITFKETSKEKIDEETLNKQEEYIKETHNEEIEISMGYKLKGEIVLEGNGKSDKIENKLWVIKIDGKWYALSRIF